MKSPFYLSIAMQHSITVHGVIVAALLSLTLVACVSPSPMTPANPTITPLPQTSGVGAIPDARAAQETLERFLTALANGDYVTAAALYEGDYEMLYDKNPIIARENYPALLEAACTVNGYVCRKPGTVTLVDTRADSWIFEVSFLNTDGSTFVFKPPPGDPGAEQSVFSFRVIMGANGPRVLDLPPYIP